MINNHKSFIPFRQLGQACPVCKREHSNCATVAGNEDLNLPIFCFHSTEDTADYRFIRITGGGALYYSKDSKRAIYELSKIDKDYQNQLSDAEFDRQFKAAYGSLTLVQSDVDKLAKKGLSLPASVLELLGFHSVPRHLKTPLGSNLPGLNPEGSLLYEYPDMVTIPALKSNKRTGEVIVTGYQFMTSVVGKKYVYHPSSHNQQGELPTTLIYANRESSTLHVSEGILKPLIAAFKLNANFFGYGGGTSFSPVALAAAIRQGRIDRVVLTPDAGYQGNLTIIATMLKYGKLAQSLGCEVVVASWKETNLDIDEISIESFKSATYEPFELVHQRLSQPNTVKADIVSNDLTKTYGELIANPDVKFVHDKSPTGSGKSTSIGKLRPNGGKIYYVNRSPLNPSTVEVSDSYSVIVGRNDGLYEQPNGSLTTSMSEVMRTPANCSYTEVFQVLREQEMSTKSICKHCPFHNKCKADSGDGYGYIHNFRKAMDNALISTSDTSLPDSLDENDTVIIDEFNSIKSTYTERINFGELFRSAMMSSELIKTYLDAMDELGLKDFDLENVKHILQLFSSPKFITLLESLASRLETDINLDGLIKTAFSSEYHAKRGGRYFNVASRLKLGTNHAKKLLRLISTPNFSVQSVDNGIVTLVVANHRVRDNILQAGTIIVGDATTSTEEIAAFFQVDSSSFTSMSYNLPLAPVKRHRITGAGAFNTIRSNAEKMNSDTLRASLPAYLKLNESDVGYIDYKKFSDSEDLTHFSTGRGSNAFKDKKALIVFGNPLANLGAIACHYEALYGMRLEGNLKDPGFQTYYSMKIKEELIQEEGRLRANRRANESLSIYFVTDREVQMEGIEDIQFHEIAKVASTTKNGKQQAREAIAKELLAKGTLSVLNLAIEAGISESAMRRYINTNYGSLEAFTAMIVESIKELDISETQVVELVPTIARLATNQYSREVISREFKDYCKRFTAIPKNKLEKPLTFETTLS